MMPISSLGRETIKRIIGRAAAQVAPQCDYRRAILVLAHMRCGSTALSNILCSRPDISGYGEAHIRHDGRGALGRLVVNQALRGAYQPGARYLFDKILHSRHDDAAPEAFFDARAVFMARAPGAAIRSIRGLYATLGRDEYRSDREAVAYYIDRMSMLRAHWTRFAPERRVALSHAALMCDPERALARISMAWELRPPLENRYTSLAASRRGGGGDPLRSGILDRVAPSGGVPEDDAAIVLQIPSEMRAEADAAYAAFKRDMAGEP